MPSAEAAAEVLAKLLLQRDARAPGTTAPLLQRDEALQVRPHAQMHVQWVVQVAL